jgi:hypothetical protein
VLSCFGRFKLLAACIIGRQTSVRKERVGIGVDISDTPTNAEPHDEHNVSSNRRTHQREQLMVPSQGASMGICDSLCGSEKSDTKSDHRREQQRKL